MGRTVIVTGASRGIGSALAAALVRRGDTVTITGRHEETVRSAADELQRLGPGTAEAATVDVRDREGMRELVEGVVARRSRLDLFINNAGVNMAGLVEDLEGTHFDAVMDTDVGGVVNGVVAAYPVMLRQGSGQLVNVSSLAGVVPSPGFAAYAAAKAAVAGLTLSLRIEAAPRGVRVNLLCPGLVETQILDQPIPDGLPETAHLLHPRSMLSAALRDGPMSSAAFAEAAIERIDRNRAVIVIPSSAARFHALYRYLPGLYDRLAIRQMVHTLADLDAQTIGATAR